MSLSDLLPEEIDSLQVTEDTLRHVQIRKNPWSVPYYTLMGTVFYVLVNKEQAVWRWNINFILYLIPILIISRDIRHCLFM